MSTLAGYYVNPHRTQFDGTPLAGENCTPDSGANGANAATGGRVDVSGGHVRSLVRRSEETDPGSPGWSIPDLDKAMTRLGVSFANGTGNGWSGIDAARRAGQYVTIQGDSDQFSNGTCSGAFNGPHCIGKHPAHRIHNGRTQSWIDDPICNVGRWEDDIVIRRYAEKLATDIRFGIFTHPVPKAAPAPIYHLSFLGGSFFIYHLLPDGSIRPGSAGRTSDSFPAPTGAHCTAAAWHHWPGSTSRLLVKMTEGALRGQYVGLGSTVKLEKVS